MDTTELGLVKVMRFSVNLLVYPTIVFQSGKGAKKVVAMTGTTEEVGVSMGGERVDGEGGFCDRMKYNEI